MISWNVNGLRAALGKGFRDFVLEQQPDILALQETKMQQGQAEVDLPGYHEYWNSAEKKGYSGTVVFTKVKPAAVSYDIGYPELDAEGRVICLEYQDFFFVDVYTPNSQDGLRRLPTRMLWEDAFRSYLAKLDQIKPVIVCGDMNVAHEEIDLKNPNTNHLNAGFSDEERGKFTELLESGFVDVFRSLYPDKVAYSWWSFRMRSRERNVGWRIDYFLASRRYLPRAKDCVILSEVFGSDHCPVMLLTED